jgi:hypothetical protein
MNPMKLMIKIPVLLIVPILLIGSGCTLVEQLMPNRNLPPEAAEFARQLGISEAEALRRLEAQGEIGELNRALQEGEPETFAGLWIRHDPVFRVMVAFTEDEEQTIRPYLEDIPWAGFVELRRFTYSLRELEAAQQQAIQSANALGLSTISYLSVPENRVTIEVGNPDLFLEEMRQSGWTPPEMVDVMAIDPNRLSDTLRGGVETYQGPDGETIYFPKQPPVGAYMQALLEGQLVLDPDGCLRVEAMGIYSYLVLWHHDFELRIDGDSIEILDGNGQVVAGVGEAVSMGGGGSSAGSIPDMPIEACPEPYWALGDILPR